MQIFLGAFNRPFAQYAFRPFLRSDFQSQPPRPFHDPISNVGSAILMLSPGKVSNIEYEGCSDRVSSK